MRTNKLNERLVRHIKMKKYAACLQHSPNTMSLQREEEKYNTTYSLLPHWLLKCLGLMCIAVLVVVSFHDARFKMREYLVTSF